jgi:iron complex outermembrane receptor protein
VQFRSSIRAVSLCLLASPVSALEELPEILVTAEFRDTKLLQSSASISVLGADLIHQRAAQHLEEILNVAPNVNFASGTSRARYFQIRGVGDRSQFETPLNPSVGFLLDGVDFSGIGSIGTLFDVEQVEILRGPQGTLHGANALAGLINVNSAAPSEEQYNHLEASAGDYDSYSLGFVSSGPISDSLLYRIAAQTFTSDGYTDNNYLDKNDTSDRDESTLRGRLRWLASDIHSLDLNISWIDLDNGYDAYSLDNNRDTLSDEPGKDTQESTSVALQSDSQFQRIQVQTLLSYANTDSDYSYDEDWTYVGFHPDGYSSTDHYSRQRDSVSAELRLLSTEASKVFGNKTAWVTGLYYLSNDEQLDRRYTYAADFDSDYDTETFAAFVQLDTALSDKLTLITGLRWENRSIDYSDNNGVNFDPDENLWGGKLALEYDWSDSTMSYASISRGYRGNGINAGILASIDATEDPAIIDTLNKVRTFDEETLINYELGIKSSLLHNSLQARLALFYMDRDDQQVNGSFLIPQDDGGTSFVDYTSNAAEGENYGAELEIDWLASDALRLWANLGLLDTEFDDYVNVFGEDLSGRSQAQAPEYQYSLGGRYDFSPGVFLRLEVEGKDKFYFSDRHNEQSDSYDLVNASAGIERQQWTLTLWGRNLTDEDYYVRGFGSFGNDPRKGYITEPYYQFGEPRMYGVTASYTF